MEARERLQALMDAQGLNRASLARMAGVGATWLRDFFDGRSKDPQYGNLQKVATALGTTPEYIMEGRNASSPDAENVVGFWEALPPPERAKARRELLRRFADDEDLKRN